MNITPQPCPQTDVFDDERAETVQRYGDEAAAREIIEAVHADALTPNQGRSAVDFLSQLLRGPPSQDCAVSGLSLAG